MVILETQPRDASSVGPRESRVTGMPRFNRPTRRRAARSGGATDARIGGYAMRYGWLAALVAFGIGLVAYPNRELAPTPTAYIGPATFLLTIRYTSIVHEYSDWRSCSIAASFIESNPPAVIDGMSRDVTCEEVQ